MPLQEELSRLVPKWHRIRELAKQADFKFLMEMAGESLYNALRALMPLKGGRSVCVFSGRCFFPGMYTCEVWVGRWIRLKLPWHKKGYSVPPKDMLLVLKYCGGGIARAVRKSIRHVLFEVVSAVRTIRVDAPCVAMSIDPPVKMSLPPSLDYHLMVDSIIINSTFPELVLLNRGHHKVNVRFMELDTLQLIDLLGDEVTALLEHLVRLRRKREEKIERALKRVWEAVAPWAVEKTLSG